MRGEGLVPTFAVARPQLRLRLRRVSEVTGAHAIVGEPYGDDLLAVVVLDDGTSVRTVDAAHVDAWATDVDEVAAIARQNTIVAPDLMQQPFTHVNGAELLVLSTPQSTYGAAQAIWPGRWLEGLGAAGVLVAVPNRQIALLHAIVDRRVLEVMEWARPWVAARIAAPGAISPHFYWWRGPGQAVRLPDERFDALLATLPE